MKNKVIIIAVLLAVCLAVLMIALYYSQDPTVGNITLTDCNKYMETNGYIKKLIKNNYINPIPKDIPEDCISEYYYNYQCDFYVNIRFTIYLGLSSVNVERYSLEKDRLNAMWRGYARDRGRGDRADIYCINME